MIAGPGRTPRALLSMLAGLVLVVVALGVIWGLTGEVGPPDEQPVSPETPEVGIGTTDQTTPTSVVTSTAQTTAGLAPMSSSPTTEMVDDEPDANAFEPGTVTVSIDGVDDDAGSLAGVLYRSGVSLANAIGGFGVAVDSDSFTTRQVVSEPLLDPDYGSSLFPYVSDEPLVIESDNYYLVLWFASSEIGTYSRWTPAASEGLRGCQIQFSTEAGEAVHISVTELPSTGTEALLICPGLSWETIPSSSFLQEEEAWGITLDDPSPGIHTVYMIRTFGQLRAADVQDVGGRLVWEQTEIELCRIGVRSPGGGPVQIGDIFQTTEGCGPNTGMQQAFDDFGLPHTACILVSTDGTDHEYCAPLTVD